ncbi:hypothetical protein QP196_10105 [Streptococcus agalactiae]|nr:hypothetical protein [Streptococcus agalactiae]MDK6471387.1 hypothetical protein [Streptococcus agalactiae]
MSCRDRPELSKMVLLKGSTVTVSPLRNWPNSRTFVRPIVTVGCTQGP